MRQFNDVEDLSYGTVVNIREDGHHDHNQHYSLQSPLEYIIIVMINIL